MPRQCPADTIYLEDIDDCVPIAAPLRKTKKGAIAKRRKKCAIEPTYTNNKASCRTGTYPRYSTATGRICCVKTKAKKKAVRRLVDGVPRVIRTNEKTGRQYYMKGGKRVTYRPSQARPPAAIKRLLRRSRSPKRKTKTKRKKTATKSKGVKRVIGGKTRTVYTGPRGGKYYMVKGEKKRLPKKK